MRWVKRSERVDYSKCQNGYGAGLPVHRTNQLPTHTPVHLPPPPAEMTTHSRRIDSS